MAESLIAVTGATGHLGRLVVESLLERGIPAARIVAVVRDPGRAGDLSSLGVQVRRADYADPEALDAAFQGVGRVLLVSGLDMGERVHQHENVVQAARRAGVELLAYTSIINAGTSTMILAGDHQKTEAIIRESGVPYSLLRNGWYLENYTAAIQQGKEGGVILGSAGDGRVSAAARKDYAAAAAEVLTGQGHANSVYELGGDTAFTMGELAGLVGRQYGREVVYRDLPEEEYAAALAGFGIPAPYAHVLADSNVGHRRGELFTESRDLHRLIGRPTRTMAEAVGS